VDRPLADTPGDFDVDATAIPFRVFGLNGRVQNHPSRPPKSVARWKSLKIRFSMQKFGHLIFDNLEFHAIRIHAVAWLWALAVLRMSILPGKM